MPQSAASNDRGIEVGRAPSRRRRNMVKVIVGYELKEGADIQAVLVKLRSYALTFPGFISAEHIRSVKDTSIVALLYNWERLENWEAWESSKISQQILQEAKEFLASDPRITVYTIMPTSAWTYTGLSK